MIYCASEKLEIIRLVEQSPNVRSSLIFYTVRAMLRLKFPPAAPGGQPPVWAPTAFDNLLFR
jgi:hypothetical protein